MSDPEFRARRDAAIARWQAKNGDKLRAANRRYARRMPREQRAYWNHYNRLRRAGCEPDPAARSFIPVLMLDPCAYCGRRAESVDHIDPIVHGGDGSTDNLTAACLSCNKRKKDRPLLTYLLAVAGG